ncbi:MAG: LytR C-terminal domain-containing protein [Marmoricola sp.]
MTFPHRDEHGFVLPTRLLALCISAVALAGLVFIANDPDRAPDDEATPAVTQPSAEPSETPSATSTPTAPVKPKPKPLKRGKIYVEVFNNTSIKGLAGGVAGKAAAGGWNVVGSDNWYGTVDGTTVYYPPRLHDAGKALGKDLGIRKVKPAEEPMSFDRLTVILTEDYNP